MAKSLLLNVFVDVLGNYVDGLSKENLRVGVWSGKIELYNLMLKSSALDELNLPISVTKGSLKQLKLKIPWASLEKKPIKVIIDGVYLQAAPLDIASMSAEDIRKLLLTTKLKKIKELELAIIAALKKPIDLQQKAQKVTYFQQLATTIINNLEVSIKNIHIRYEDSYTIPGTCISTGVTLYSISLSTTDDNWNIKFINTNTNTNNKNSKLGTSSNHGNTTSHNISTESLLSGNIIHKLGLMENLSVYWETDSEQFDKPEIDFYDWEKLMQDFIFSVDNNMDLDTMGTKHTDYTKYLLHPYNRFTVKIIHRQNKNASGTSASNSSNTNNNVPTLDVTVENSTVPFQLDKLQYHQLLLLVKKFGELERLKQMALYRPDKRPLDGKKAVREWWHYAYKLVSGKDFSAANQMAMISRCVKSRKRYITLIKKRRLHLEFGEPDKNQKSTDKRKKGQPLFPDLTEAECQALETIQRDLPLAALLTFHSSAVQEAAEEIERLKISMETQKMREDELEHSKEGTKKKGLLSSMASLTSKFGDSPFKDRIDPLLLQKLKEKPDFTALAKKMVFMGPSSTASTHSDDTSSIDEEDTAADDDDLMEQIEYRLQTIHQEAMNVSDQFSKNGDKNINKGTFPLRFKMISSGSLRMTYHQSPLLSADMSLTAVAEIRSSGISVTLDMDNLEVSDECTVGAVNNKLISGTRLGDKRLSVGIQNDSQCRIEFTSKPNSSHLKLVAHPLTITWNEACIQRLMAFVLVKGVFEDNPRNNMSSMMKSSPLLIRSMNRFAKEASAPVKNTTVEIKLHAPKFIIPESSQEMPGGCLVLDSGELVVEGLLGHTGMQFDVNLRTINISMPLSYMDMKAQAKTYRETLYLVKPFDISISMENINRTIAEMTIVSAITPGIIISMDVVKVVRLLKLVQVLQRSINLTSYINAEEEHTGVFISNRESHSSSLSLTPTDINTVMDISRSVASPKAAASGDGIKKKLAFSFTLAKISTTVIVNEQQNIVLTIGELKTFITRREYDTELALKLKSIVITDTMRPKTYGELVWTVESSQIKQEQNFISINAKIVNNKKSSYYNGFKNDLQLAIGKLAFCLDESAIYRLVPFLSNFTSEMSDLKQYNLKSKEVYKDMYRFQRWDTEEANETSLRFSDKSYNAQFQKFNRGRGKTNGLTLNDLTQANAKFGGTHVDMKVDSVAIHLMTEQHNPDHSTKRLSTAGSIAKVPALESAFSIEVAGLAVDLQLLTLKRLEAHLSSISVSDKRTISQSYAYRDIFTQSTVGSEYTYCNQSSHDELLKKSSLVKSSPNNTPIFSIVINEESSSHADISVSIRDITTFLSAEIILTLVNVAGVNAHALKELVNAAQESKFTAEDSGGSAGVSGGLPTIEDDEASEDDSRLRTFVASITAINPRILLVDDPTVKSSKAVVFDCSFSLHAVRDITNFTTVKDSFHASVKDAEVVIVTSLVQGVPQQLLLPTSIDCHVSRIVEKGCALQSDVALVIGSIVARVSLNDIVILSSIMKKALKIREEKRDESIVENMEDDIKQLSQTIKESSKKTNTAKFQVLTMYNGTVEVPTISCTLINDYNNQNIPILRICVEDTEVNVSGAIRQLEGSGSLIICGDYYNVSGCAWEPFIEKWSPEITLSRTSHRGIELEVLASDPLQINGSGKLLQCFHNAKWLMEKIGRESITKMPTARSAESSVAQIIVVNQLDVPITIKDSATKELLLTLTDSVAIQLPSLLSSNLSDNNVVIDMLSRQLDVYFEDLLGTLRMPLLQLPLNMHRPRFYPVQVIKEAEGSDVKVSLPQIISHEPVVETVYELARFNPLQRKWTEPWPSLQDPPRWVDVRGKGTVQPREVALPSSGLWEWIEADWRVDMTGDVGVEIDKDGWEYATNFSAFTQAKSKRAQQPMDVVRRRRWIRSRIVHNRESAATSEAPIQGTDTESVFLAVVWDCKINHDGSRRLDIRTNKVVRNDLPFDVQIEMSDIPAKALQLIDACQKLNEIMKGGVAKKVVTIPAGTMYSIPLLYLNAQRLRVRPFFEGSRQFFEWSDKIDLRLKATSITGAPDIKPGVCQALNVSMNDHIRFTIGTTQVKKYLEISFMANLKFDNRLPCLAKFQIKQVLDGEVVEEAGSVAAGDQLKVSRVDNYSHAQPEMHFYVGDYYSLEPMKYLRKKEKEVITILLVNDNDSANKLCLSVKLYLDKFGIPTISIFSKYLMVDRCASTAACVKSRVGEGNYIMRKCNAISSHGLLLKEEDAVGMVTEAALLNGLKETVQSCWVNGENGLLMFHSDDGKVSIGINDGAGWAKDIPISELSGTAVKSTLEIQDESTSQGYNVAIKVSTLEGAFSDTQVMTIMPWFCVVNCTKDFLELLQDGLCDVQDDFAGGSSKSDYLSPVTSFDPYSIGEWHKPVHNYGTKIRFRCRPVEYDMESTTQTTWSIGCVDLNEIGSTTLILPDESSNLEEDKLIRNYLTVLNIEVRLAELSDYSYINVIVWKSFVRQREHPQRALRPAITDKFAQYESLITTSAAMSVKNESKYNIYVYQKTLTDSDSSGKGSISDINMNAITLHVSPGGWQPLGWTKPSTKSKMRIVVGLPDNEEQDDEDDGIQEFDDLTRFHSSRSASINMMKINKPTVLSFDDRGRIEEITVVVTMIGSSKVLRITSANTSTSSKRGAATTIAMYKSMLSQRKADEILSGKESELITLKVKLKAVSMSIIAEKPRRREFMSISMKNLELLVRKIPENNKSWQSSSSNDSFSDVSTHSNEVMTTENAMLWIDFRIKDVQIDNYSETVTYPVLLSSLNSTEKRQHEKRTTSKQRDSISSDMSLTESDTKSAPYFITFSLLRETPKGESTSIVKYTALRVLEMKFSIDSATILLYFSDIHGDFTSNVNRIEMNDSETIKTYIDDINTYYGQTNCAHLIEGYLHDSGKSKHEFNLLVSPEIVDMKRTVQLAQEQKVYFENIAIHPLKLNISFLNTTFPRDVSKDMPDAIATTVSRYINKLQLISSIEDFELKVKSFIVENVTESVSSLKSRVIRKTMREMQANLVVIAGSFFGSMSLLGKPVGLYSNIGTGVQDFFYEPYMGIMESSPQGFLLGIGKGTQSLVSGVVVGALSSTASIVGAASSGVASGVATGAATLSGNSEDFIKKREEKKRQQGRGPQGILSGLKAGGESFVGGITSGITGLVTKPIEEGRKGGALGLIKGVGLGVVGVAVNPILGVTDGISSVAEGLTKQMNISSAVGIGLVRPPRAFERSSVDTEDLILVPIDVYKSYAQFLVFRAAEEIKKKDYYLCMAYLGFTPAKGTRSIPYSILLSERFIRLLSSALEIIWEYPYGDISHATINQQDPSTVVIIRYEQSSSKAVSERSKINIGCQNVKAAIQVYSVIYRNSYRLGNASLMESIDSVKARLLESDSLSYEEMLDKKVPKMDPNSSYTGLSYVMGTANKLKVKPEKMQSEKFWSWAQLQLASQPGYDELIKTGLTPNLADHQYLQMIDEKLWRVVQTWSRNHSTFKLSRCCACLIFNHSSHAVQILDVSIKEGRDVHLFGVGKHGYDADARLIAKENGAVVVFGVANTPNLVQKGHIKININSTAFSIQVSTRKSGGEAEGNEAYTISFLEKSITEWWAKYAIIIK